MMKPMFLPNLPATHYRTGLRIGGGAQVIAAGAGSARFGSGFRARFAPAPFVTDGDTAKDVTTVTGVGGVEPYAYSKVSGAAELTIHATTGVVSFAGTAAWGAPDYIAMFRVTDSTPTTPLTADITITVPVVGLPLGAITFNPANPTATANDANPEQVTTASVTGGSGGITWLIVSGSPGYTIDAGGIVTRADSRPVGTDTVRVRATDGAGQEVEAEVSVQLANYVPPVLDLAATPLNNAIRVTWTPNP